MKTKNIYLDYAAATPVHLEVLKAMEPYWSTIYGNPSSIHSFGRDAHDAVEQARRTIASILRCSPEEIIFTASATESALLAIRGVARAGQGKKHIITSQIEHPAVLTACEQLATEGFEITYLPVDTHGLINIDELEKAIRPDTALISIMYANNEIGTVQVIKDIAKITRKRHVPFHTDAAQAAGLLDIRVDELDIDLMTINASKIYGPKGVGLLYVRTGIALDPIMPGGGQELDRRGGTENVPGIVGFAKALEIASKDKTEEAARLTKLRDIFINKLEELPDFHLNGHRTKRLSNNIHGSFSGFDGQTIVGLLDQKGIACSSASACASASPEPSHVLLATGASYTEAFEGLRFSLGTYTTESDIDYVITVLKDITATGK